jgi:hypothetical protein
MDNTCQTALIKGESLLSAKEIEVGTVTSAIVDRYYGEFPELTGDTLRETITADFVDADPDGFPPFIDVEAYTRLNEIDGEPELTQEEKDALDVCDECEKPFTECACGDEDETQWKQYRATLQNRWDSDVSTLHDGDDRWTGQHFEPVFETGESERDEYSEAYFGGHTFRDHGITQLIRATSEAAGVPEPFCALMSLFTFSSALGKGLQVSFKPGEQTSLGIYSLALADSGGGKTKGGKILCSPLTDIHHRAKKRVGTAG